MARERKTFWKGVTVFPVLLERERRAAESVALDLEALKPRPRAIVTITGRMTRRKRWITPALPRPSSSSRATSSADESPEGCCIALQRDVGALPKPRRLW